MKALRLMAAASSAYSPCLVIFILWIRQASAEPIFVFTQAKSIRSCYGGTRIEFIADIMDIRYVGNTGNGIDNEIFYYGAYEKHILYFFRDVMRGVYGNHGTFVDVGANTGQHALDVSRFASEVHSFEPWEPVLERFRRMVEANHIKNIVIHPVGLGNEDAKVPTNRPKTIWMPVPSLAASIRTPPMGANWKSKSGIKPWSKPELKMLCSLNMDIEGYEELALLGLRHTLREDRPIVEFDLSIDPKGGRSVSKAKRSWPLSFRTIMLSWCLLDRTIRHRKPASHSERARHPQEYRRASCLSRKELST